jgi:hypothetical protein
MSQHAAIWNMYSSIAFTTRSIAFRITTDMADGLDNVTIRSFLIPERAYDVTFVDTPDGTSEFLFAPREDLKPATGDAESAAKAFLEARTPASLLRVFRRFGPLRHWMGSLSLTDAKNWQKLFQTLGSSQLTYEQMCSLRKDMIEMQAQNVHFDFLKLPQLSAEWTSPLRILAVCADLMEAVAVSLFLDRANSRLWRLCEWKPCGKLFVRQRGSKKKFHDHTCAQKAAHWRWDQRGRVSERVPRTTLNNSKGRARRKA